MRALLRAVWLLAIAKVGHALIGISIPMYQPSCAHACRRALRNVRLDCSKEVAPEEGGLSFVSNSTASVNTTVTTVECYANTTAFLTTLARCIEHACAKEHYPPVVWELERFWSQHVSGHTDYPPRSSYEQSLQQNTTVVVSGFIATGFLNHTAVVPDTLWLINKLSLEAFEHQESLHTHYGLFVLLAGTFTPVIFTLLLFLPCLPTFISRIKPYLIYPAIFRSNHLQNLPHSLGNAPTMGQSLYLVLFFLLNIIFTAVRYRSQQPNTLYSSTREEILLYIANRTGIMAFALLPLVLLFAGRNNFLLWLTNWSHATYLLFHRHVARLFTVHCVIHSIVEIELYKSQGTIVEELRLPYWIWGVVATVAACALVLFSIRWVRQISYEIFLALHILFAVALLIGCWYHIDLLFKKRWGYQYWLYTAFAVWAFDRFARLLRLAQTGLLKADIQELGTSGIVRIDIPNVRWSTTPGQHAYNSFPTTFSRFRPWESHPFSIIPLSHCPDTTIASDEDNLTSALTAVSRPTPSNRTSETLTVITDLEKAVVSSKVQHISIPTHRPIIRPGIRLYVKKHRGLTSRLHTARNISVLLEGPYHIHNTTINAHTSIASCDKLLLFAGGIGITGVASWIRAHPNVKLYWSVREHSRALVDDIHSSGLLEPLMKSGRVEVTITGSGARRRDLGETVEHDVMDALQDCVGKGVRVGVVSCGSPEFCDGVRSAVVMVGRRVGGFVGLEYVEEAFGW